MRRIDRALTQPRLGEERVGPAEILSVFVYQGVGFLLDRAAIIWAQVKNQYINLCAPGRFICVGAHLNQILRIFALKDVLPMTGAT